MLKSTRAPCALPCIALLVLCTAAPACDSVSGAVDAGADASSAVVPDLDAGGPARDALVPLADGATSADAAGRDAASADAPVDAASALDAEAASDASDAGDAGGDASADAADTSVVSAPACTTERCCLPLTHADDSSCSADVCIAHDLDLTENGASGGPAILRCYGPGDASIRMSGDGTGLTLALDPARCATTDAAALRAAIVSVSALTTGTAIDSLGDVLLTIDGDAQTVKDLQITAGRLRLVIEGTIDAADEVVGLSADCASGHTLPFGLCNCQFTGVGPKARFTFDVPFMVQ